MENVKRGSLPPAESSGKESKEFASFVQEGGFIWGIRT